MICLLPNCCFLSETSRTIAIAKALRDRGAPLRIATHGGTYEHLITAAGFDHDRLGPPWSAERCAEFVRAVPGIGAPDQSMWSDEELRTYARAEAAYFAEHGVRVAVTGWTLTALLSTRLAGIPLVTGHAGALIPPLFERGLLPAPTRPMGLPFERVMPSWLRRRLYNAGLPGRQLYTGGLNRVAAELGVEGVPSLPAMLLGDLSLVTDVPEVIGVSRERVDGWTPRNPAGYRSGTRLRYAGPLFAQLEIPVPDRVDRFLTEPGPPVVYVAITSSSAELVREVVAGLADLDVRVLVAATVHDLSDLESDRVLVEGLLPSHLVMPRVAAAVIAGGQGSVQTALASGLPFVGIPLQPEQDANVTLVVRRGAALRVRPDRVAGDGPRAVRVILTDGRHRARARELQRAYARVDGPGVCADIVLEVAADPGPVRGPARTAQVGGRSARLPGR